MGVHTQRNKGTRPPPTSRAVAVVCAVASYMVVSISIVMVNKMLLRGKLPYPILMTLAQQVVSLFCFAAVGALAQATGFPSFWPRPEFKVTRLVRVAPLSVVMVTMIALNNACLRYVEASFYMVARSTHILFSILLAYALHGTTVSAKKSAACAAVTVGLLVSSLGEGPRFSAFGTLLGVASTAFVALYSIRVGDTLPVVAGDKWLLAQYNTIASVVLLPVAAAATGELARFSESDSASFASWMGGTTAAADTALLLLSGALGFLITLASYAQITLTDPLTHMVSGTVKGIIQTGLSAWAFGTPLTHLNLAGTALVVAGSFAYSFIRIREAHSQPGTKNTDRKNNDNKKKSIKKKKKKKK